MSKRLVVGISILTVLLLIGGLVIWQGTRQGETDVALPLPAPESAASATPVVQGVTTAPASASIPSETAETTSSAASSTVATTAAGNVPAGCMPTLTEIQPTTFAIDQMKVTAPMLALSEDESGAAAAPPKNASHSVGWWKNGPKVGSKQGHAILTIHTYQNGRALGNELYNTSSGLKEGDLIRMTDQQGNTQCYTMERTLKLWVKDYDPLSDVLYKFSGEPRAVIVICWDYNFLGKEWDSRILYYLKPVALAA